MSSGRSGGGDGMLSSGGEGAVVSVEVVVGCDCGGNGSEGVVEVGPSRISRISGSRSSSIGSSWTRRWKVVEPSVVRVGANKCTGAWSAATGM